MHIKFNYEYISNSLYSEYKNALLEESYLYKKCIFTYFCSNLSNALTYLTPLIEILLYYE